MSKHLHKRVSDVKAFAAGDATFIREILHPRNEGIDLPYSLAYGSLEVGASSIPHVLQNDELYYILDGKAAIQNGEEVIEVNAHEVFLVRKNTRQFVRNLGDKKLIFLCIVSPPWSEDKEEIL
jgi:mannose-6-phosphate isomerase-like protein (cupin superfamily)